LLCLTISALAGPILSGCGTANETGVVARSHNDEPLALPDRGPAERDAVPEVGAEALHGAWRWDYITAGAVQMHRILEFEPAGTLTVGGRSMWSLTEPAETSAHAGFFEVTQQGTVRYGWGDGVVGEAEHSLTFLENPEIISIHPCCRANPLTERYWTHRGYLARDAERTRFERIAMDRVLEEDGSLRSSQRTHTELVFSEPPAQLEEDDECSLQVTIAVDVTEAGLQELGEHELTLPCRVQVDGAAKVLTVPGLDISQDRPLLEGPSYARGVWYELLEEQQSVEGWSVTIVRAFADAFEPYLAFDPARPDVLFHYLDPHAGSVRGYRQVAP
jgi:hypothetical protein